MQKERLAFIGAQMAGQRLDAVASQIHHGHNKTGLRQAKRKFRPDRGKDCRQHARKYINEKMNRRKHQQLQPVECRQFPSQSGCQIRYSLEIVRITKLPRTAAGVDMHISSSLLLASTLNSVPA